MARTVTLAQMRTRVYRRCDAENATDRFPVSEVNDELNEGVAELFDEILRARGKGFFRKAYNITTTASTSLYNLPADFYQLLSVEANVYGVGRSVYEFNMQDHAILTTPGYSTDGVSFSYSLVGKPDFSSTDQIEFLPVQNLGQLVTVYYIPASAKLVNDTDVFDGYGGWEEFAILCAAIALMTKDKDTETLQNLSMKKEGIRQRIQGMAPKRDNVRPSVVTDAWGPRNTRMRFTR